MRELNSNEVQIVTGGVSIFVDFVKMAAYDLAKEWVVNGYRTGADPDYYRMDSLGNWY